MEDYLCKLKVSTKNKKYIISTSFVRNSICKCFEINAYNLVYLLQASTHKRQTYEENRILNRCWNVRREWLQDLSRQ